jgi:light-regulated signal transduction histidine kinase (bacteriophytochrome)
MGGGDARGIAVVDVTDCDREPIHVPGSIQPFGVLFALDEATNVTQVSENVGDHLSWRVDEVLGRPLAEIVDPIAAEGVRSVLREQRWHDANPLSIAACGKRFDGIVHHHEGAAILELEPNPEIADERSIHHPFRAALLRVQRASTLGELAEIVTQEMRQTTGFDRVMFYRFHEDGSGSVDAEARGEAHEPYLGLRYPASDIPAQARRLYLKNWLRLIFDADQKPARIVPPLRPDTGKPLDLSFSVLRSVSPIHIEYMKNMGVCASMSISLIVRNQLWGLISCVHHTGPRRVSHRMRSACEFMGRLASLQIASFEDRELVASRASRRATVDALHGAMKAGTGSVFAALAGQPGALMGLVDAGGVAVVENGETVTCGLAPPDNVLREIARWLEERGDLRPFASASLGALFPPALAAIDVASGLLTFALPGARLMWFRPEVIHTVNWGGDPAKPVEAEAGQRLRPRHSFALWKEEVRARSRPWTPSDLEAADELQRRATEVDIERRLFSEQRAVRARDELLAVVSHDLGNPLAVILLEAAHLLAHLPETGDERARTLRESVELIRRSTARMKALIDDLLELERLGTTSFPLDVRPVESRDLLEDAVTDAQPLADAKQISLLVALGDPPRIDADPHRISQVLSNLLGNAIKFTPEGGTVTLSAQPRNGALWVTIADTGPGIAPQYLAHIFERYWRPKRSEGEGTGLGLYIARGIVEAHGGRVWAESSPQGATFVFTLPLEPRRG